MRRRKRWSCFLAVLCVVTMLSGCAGSSTSAQKGGSNDGKSKSSTHEPITINAPYQNISAFTDKVHEKYPEINIEVVPYSGANTTAWMKGQVS